MKRETPTDAHTPWQASGVRTLKVTPRRLRVGMSLYPPLLFSGVRVEHVAEDWTTIRVRYRVRWWNRNHNGAAFGGTLFAMTDPFFGMLALGQLGNGYRIWNTSASIEFLAAGRGSVSATMSLDPAVTSAMRNETADGSKSITSHCAEVVAADGTVVARVRQTLYVRKYIPK